MKKPKINKVIQVLILSDLLLITGFGFVTPIFAIFITEQIQGGDVKVVGFAAAIYWIVQSLVVVPFGRFLDKNFGEKDDIWFVILGNLLAAVAAFGYIFSYLPVHVYLLQVLYALGMGMNIPGYTAIFTRHIDKKRVAFDWSVRSSLIGIGTGAAGALGGIIANKFGFQTLFVGVGSFIILSSFLLFLIYGKIVPKKGKKPRIIVAKKLQPRSYPKH